MGAEERDDARIDFLGSAEAENQIRMPVVGGELRLASGVPVLLLAGPHLVPRAYPGRRREQIDRPGDEERGLPAPREARAVVDRSVQRDESIAPRPLDELAEDAGRDVLHDVGEELAIEAPVDVAGVHGELRDGRMEPSADGDQRSRDEPGPAPGGEEGNTQQAPERVASVA